MSLPVPGWCELDEGEFDPSQSCLSQQKTISEPLASATFLSGHRQSRPTRPREVPRGSFSVYTTRTSTSSKKFVCRRHRACQRCEVAVPTDVTVHIYVDRTTS